MALRDTASGQVFLAFCERATFAQANLPRYLLRRREAKTGVDGPFDR